MTSGGLVNPLVENSGSNFQLRWVKSVSRVIKFQFRKNQGSFEETIVLDGQQLKFCAATIGNPHCVVLNGEQTQGEVRRIGPLIETHPNFPNRINVQFLGSTGPW
ncbi:MAG: hypothetical protein Ct9H300mP28_01480 [Pseudomonadota bacterium]|nr:MAG: hypothetical protein Ct9H300mP28_01480 [Pseudomonadota bacterium]